MKHLPLSLFVLFFCIENSFAQDHISQEAFDHYWNSLNEHNHMYTQQQKEEEKLEISKIRDLIHQSIHNELEEVKELSSDIVTNFAVIEDHFYQEFEALGLAYTRYEQHENRSSMPKEHWVDHHTNKIIEYKLAHIEKEIKEFYD